MRRSTLLFVLFAAACGGSPLLANPGVPVDLKVLNAHRADYANKSISVRGRIHVETYRSLEPCGSTTPDCDRPFATSVHVVVPGEARSEENSVDLYREASNGTFEPATCRIVSSTAVDCGDLTRDATATVTGTFLKTRVPYQTVGGSGGPTIVLQYRDAHVLVIR